MDYFGRFPDLSRSGNTGLYNKEEPPSLFCNRHLPQSKKLDFIITGPEKARIEAKNIREWLYPDWDEFRDFLFKTTELILVPVLIARRIPYVTFMLLEQCGCVFQQNYNQLMDKRDITIADDSISSYLHSPNGYLKLGYRILFSDIECLVRQSSGQTVVRLFEPWFI